MSTLTIIGELMNNSYARARKAWQERNLAGYQELAKLQTSLGASYLTLNVDGTAKLPVTLAEMLAGLPTIIPAIQAVTDLPISFDNPDVAFHLEAVKHFDRSKSRGRPILNSLSVTRHDVTAMIDIVKAHDMNVIVMASERLRPDGTPGPAEEPEHIVAVTRHFVQLLHDRGGIENDRIIVDPGLCPVASDTHGGINLCLDSIRAIRADALLKGVHISVGLSNFSIGAPKDLRIPLERAFLALAQDAGMDWALANPEKNTTPMPRSEPLVATLANILAEGKVRPGESKEDAGYRQLDTLMELWAEQ